MKLDGRVALITGGAGGIGLAVARRFTAAGAHVALADQRGEASVKAAKALEQQGTRAFGLTGDVSNPADAEALVAGALEKFGRIDILVNNAGIMGRAAPLWELQDKDWDDVLRIDLTSVFLVTRAVIRHMRPRKSGCIVSVASIAGKEGTAQLIPYSVAKAGIIAFTKALGKEVVADGIRVNCVAPGVVETPLLEQLPAETTRAMLLKSPMGRFGTADEVAAVVHFLASDSASFITSQCFDVSGGRA
ncbi:MAG TPA: SDR family NAD(P)-dependent oxidoreductase, partial [Steroidobacteraceae bacterium]|nr:SDR family NAD(P)-dependent oxidoreductase [Steroidobacteraceae bacterium]